MDRYFANVSKKPGANSSNTELVDGPQPEAEGLASKKSLPQGVVLGKDEKPCRSCTSVAAWAKMIRAQEGTAKRSSDTTKFHDSSSSSSDSSSASSISRTSLQHASPQTLPPDCPADVETLGRSTWTFLHTLSASYPDSPSKTQQSEMRSFMSLFAKLYPCWHCAEDFREWISRPENAPRVEGKDKFGIWMCDAHNEVNRKLGKQEFDCSKWRERWVDGPKDGRCG